MGILDAILNLSPEQNRGLLASAAQMLQASGPSRTPTSFGQILGGGIMAGLDATQQARQQGQLEQLRGVQIKNAESDLAAQEAQRERAQNLLRLTSQYGQSRAGGQQQSAPPMDRSAKAMFQGLMSGSAPSMTTPGAPMAGSSMAAPGGAPSGGAGDRSALVQDRLKYAQFLRDNGYTAEANAEEDQALKLQPKISAWKEVQQEGKVMFAPFFEDGSNGQPVPFEVAKELQRVNAGGTTELLNPVTGASVRSIRNTASPDALLSAQVQRENAARQDARAERANPANKPLPASALKMQQTELDALSTATGIDDQLANIQGQLESGKLSFGPVSNLVNQARNAAGMSDENSRNFASFRSTLEKLRNDSLRLNAGVQTDGDAQRAWNELFQNINDTELVKQRLIEIRAINQRAAQIRRMNVDGIRANYGHEPLDTSGYERPTTAPAQQTRQASAGGKVATLSDIAATAKASGRSTAEVTAALRAKGYTIGGK